MTTDIWINLLALNRKMTTRKEVETFEDALAKLAEKPDDTILGDLFLVFDDSCKHPEVMWGLVHFIESFDHKLVVETLLELTSQLVENAREWTKTFYRRLLNDEYTKAHLELVFTYQSQESQRAIHQILEEIA